MRDRSHARWLSSMVVLLCALTNSIATADVGRTAGASGVSASGSGQYSIPIWSPPGVGGIQPKFSLGYDSRAGVSPFGFGWSVRGLSAITRCNSTTAQDAAAAPITLTSADRFCLDGNRLRLTSSTDLSTYGEDGTTYQTELDVVSRITAHGTAGTGPAYFTVQGKNGLTYSYGSSGSNYGSNAQVLASGSATASQWLLSEVTDRAGNTMLVNYYPAQGLALPLNISWSGHTIQFTYTPVTDNSNVNGYIGGTPYADGYDLVKITVTSGAYTRILWPTLTPSPVTGRHLLTGFQECSGTASSSCLASTAFNYQNAGQGLSVTATTSSTLTTAPLTQYDFNGDGRPDLVYLAGSTWYVQLSTPSGYSAAISTGATGSGAGTMFGDVLGTGADGILANNNGTFYYYTYNSSSNSFTSVSTNLTYQNAYTQYALADIDGDGLPDVVAVSGNSVLTIGNNSRGGSSVVFSTATTAYSVSLTDFYTASLYAGRVNNSSLKTIDFNGDGREDVVLQAVTLDSKQNVHYYNYLLLSNGVGVAMTEQPLPSGKNEATVYLADWNSDSCTDAVLGPVIYISGCNGTVPVTITLPATPAPTVLAVMDWDGDGRSDLVLNNGGTLGVYRSTGTGVSNIVATTLPYRTGYFAFDADADGQDDLGFFAAGSSTLQYYAHAGAGQPPDLLLSATDGFGVNVSFTYSALTDSSVYSRSNTVLAYPDTNWAGSLYVVKNKTASDGTGGTYTQDFTYTDARVNIKGRGFEGFGSERTFDHRNSLYRTSKFLQSFPYTGVLYSDATYQSNGAAGAPGSVVSDFETDPLFLTLDATAYNSRFLTYIDHQVMTTFELTGSPVSTSTTTFGAPDQYGNNPSVVTLVTDLDPSSPNLNSIYSTTVATTVSPDAGVNWCLSLPTQVAVTKSAPGVPSITRTVQYTLPDYVNCREGNQIVEPGSSLYRVTDTYEFDTFGNISKDHRVGVNMAERLTQYNWGATGQFITTVTNALGQVYQRGYNYDLGVLSSETDPNGIQVSWLYDAWGRKTQENRPDGTYTQWQYTDCPNSGGCVFGSHGMIAVHYVYGSDASVITDGAVYFDILDRVIMSDDMLLASNTWERVDVKYDSLGRVVQRSIPCLWTTNASLCPYWSTTTYDALGRPTQIQRPIDQNNLSAQFTGISYQGMTTIVTDPQGKASKQVKNAMGLAVQSWDANSYGQAFNYDPFGSLTGVTDSQSQTLFSASYAYGLAPFQVASSSPDAGGRTAIFDALGELTNWTDAKGNQFSAQYDALSRMVTRTEPDFANSWNWGVTAAKHEIGRLASVSGGGYSETYTYDTVGRLSDKAIAIPSDGTYSYDYSYNTQGLPDTLSYPATVGTRLTLKYNYQNGFLSEVADFNAPTAPPFWIAKAANARGQVTQETLGNGVVTNRTFDGITGWMSSAQTGLNGGTALQNDSYLYDQVGNVTQRQNNNVGLTENFYYDSVYRLQTSTLISNGVTGTNLSVSYDLSGNITSRSDVAAGAAWTYDTTRIHAVTQAGSSANTYSYDANGNAQTRNGYTIGWTSFNKPTTISSAGESVSFQYNQDHERYKVAYTGSAGLETTYFIGGELLEKVVTVGGTVDYRHYIYAGGTKVAVQSRTGAGVVTTRYVREDHEGSVGGIVSADGTSYVKESFTAFGNRRSACTWSGQPTNSQLARMNAVTRHGYTWQDSLGAMGLNDMHGRIQDAVSGRFLSPDPLMSDPSNTQDFNRYSYVHNNPLSATDPSGYKIMNWFGNEPDQQWAKYRDAGIGGLGGWMTGYTLDSDGNPSLGSNIPYNNGLADWAGAAASAVAGVFGKRANWGSGAADDNFASATASQVASVLGIGVNLGGNAGGSDTSATPDDSQVVVVSPSGSSRGVSPRGNLPEVTVSTNWPVSGPPVIPISPFLAPYPAGTFQSYVNTLDTPQVCRYSSANNPNVQRNIVTGGTVGFLTLGTVGAVVVLNIVGFPEVEVAEGGAAAFGGGAWLFGAAVAEPAGSMAIGGLSAGAYGAVLGGTAGYLGTSSACP